MKNLSETKSFDNYIVQRSQTKGTGKQSIEEKEGNKQKTYFCYKQIISI